MSLRLIALLANWHPQFSQLVISAILRKAYNITWYVEILWIFPLLMQLLLIPPLTIIKS